MGSITITGRCSLTTETGGDFTDTNTVIYGHHMRDRSMFGSLEEYRS